MFTMTTTRTILLYLTVCGKGWLVIYLSWVLINSALTSLALHLMAIGLFICVVAALKLPPPDKDLVRTVLGEDLQPEDQDNPGQAGFILRS